MYNTVLGVQQVCTGVDHAACKQGQPSACARLGDWNTQLATAVGRSVRRVPHTTPQVNPLYGFSSDSALVEAAR